MTNSAFQGTPGIEPFVGTRFVRRMGFGCALLAALAVTLVAGYRIWLRNQIRAELAEIRKLHLPVTLSEVNSWYTGVQNQENAGLQFSESFNTGKLVSDEKRIPIVGSGILPKPSEPLNEDIKVMVGKYLSNNSKRLQVVHQTVQYDKSRYPIDMELGVATLLPHLNKIREAQNLLQLEAVYASETGNRAGALQSVLDQLRLARTLKNEPVMISQIYRLRLINEATRSVERIISILTLTNDEINLLAAAMLKTEEELADCWERVMAGERSMGIDIFQAPPYKIAEYFDSVESVQNSFFSSLVFAMRRLVGIWDADYLFYLKTVARANTLATRGYAEAMSEAAKIVSAAARPNSSHMISALLLPNFQSGITKLVGTRAALRTCRLALAIELYRAKTGYVPENLQQLVPDYIKALPLDPGSGLPFHYNQEKEGYLIQSTVPKAWGPDRLREKNSDDSNAKVGFMVERRR